MRLVVRRLLVNIFFFHSEGSLGSVILFTTRSQKVASNVETLPRHDLATLSEKHSWELFRYRAFNNGQELPHLIKFGKIIVRKCAGLPLALKAIGGLMRTKRELREWRSISEDQIRDSETSNKEVLPALKLSYDQLPNYMKQCFVFCAVFSHNYEIHKETLIRLWKANDLIPNDGTLDVEEKGEFIFDELCRRSFFIMQRSGWSLNNFTYCKMHDLMRDLAKYIARDQCATMHEAESGEVLHLSIFDFGNHSLENLNIILKEFSNIRTCLIPEFSKELENDNFFNPKTSLRALQMGTVNQLPKELGYLKHLRYLDLSWGKFDSLPETICTLYNLQTLILSHNPEISKLPASIIYMIGLQELVFYGCLKLESLPIGLGQLKCLRTLTQYMVGSDPGRSIGELKDLDLRGSLVISGIENINDKSEAEMANMASKTKLCSLELYWASLDNKNITRNDDAILEGVKPSKNIEHLGLHNYSGYEFAVWMKDLFAIENLRTLSFHDCMNCEALPPIWKLPLLQNLELSNMRSLFYMCSTGSIEAKKSEDQITFPCLRELKLYYLDNVKGWHENNCKLVAFPMLQELIITDCPKLTSIPFTPMLTEFVARNSNGIKLLQISNMAMEASSKLKIILNPYLTEPDAFRPPRNVEEMRVKGLNSVVPLEEKDEESSRKMALRHLYIWESNCFFSCRPSKQSLEFWKYFVSLESLNIIQCRTLSYWPEQELRGLKFLKILSILGCENFTYSTKESSSTQSSREDFLPRLHTLKISDCPKLVEVPNCSLSLKDLILRNCLSLSKEGINWIKNLPDLKKVLLSNCMGLKSLPDDYSTSLEHLCIVDCQGVESFSEGLQKQLPKLKYLQIVRCTVLERHFRDGGDYQHLVIAIPTKKIGYKD